MSVIHYPLSQSVYRTIDGKCNNLNFPTWGASNTAYRRFVNPAYSVGDRPRGGDASFEDRSPASRSVDVANRWHHGSYYRGHGQQARAEGKWQEIQRCLKSECYDDDGDRPLPNPRLVSTEIHKDVDAPVASLTHMVAQWGQFLDHDFTATPSHKDVSCCDEMEGFNSNRGKCQAILVPEEDSVFSACGKQCLPLTRSTDFCESGQSAYDRAMTVSQFLSRLLNGSNRHGSMSYYSHNGHYGKYGGDKCSDDREQQNEITHFIDASNVYGSTEEEAAKLRSFEGGELLARKTSTGKDVLPVHDDSMTAGDARAGENPGLASLHTLWLREHNRLAREIAAADANLSDEEIYQIARKILIAQMQVIAASLSEGFAEKNGPFARSSSTRSTCPPSWATRPSTFTT